MTIQRQETAQSPPAPTAYWSIYFQHDDDDEKEGHDGNDYDDDEEEGQVGWVTSLIGISAKVRNLKLLLGDNLPP